MDVLSRRDPRRRRPTGRRVKLNARDRKILQLHAQVRYIRSTWLSAFFPIKERHALLHRVGDDIFNELGYLDRPQEQFRYNKSGPVTAPVIHELDTTGWQYLQSLGLCPYSADMQPGHPEGGYFWHHVAICDVILSMMLSKTGRFISAQEILERAPNHTLKMQYDGEYLTPDLLCGRETAEGYLFCKGEVDLGNMSHKRYKEKTRRHLEFPYKDHLGITADLVTLHLTTSEDRMHTMIQHLLELTNGKGNRYQYFKVIKGDILKGPPPTSHIIDEEWQRAGYPSIKIA